MRKSLEICRENSLISGIITGNVLYPNSQGRDSALYDTMIHSLVLSAFIHAMTADVVEVIGLCYHFSPTGGIL